MTEEAITCEPSGRNHQTETETARVTRTGIPPLSGSLLILEVQDDGTERLETHNQGPVTEVVTRNDISSSGREICRKTFFISQETSFPAK